MKISTVLTFLLTGLVLSQPAYALFEDEKARERIIEVEKKVINNQQDLSGKLSTVKQQLDELESLVKGQGLADLLNQIERLNRENAQLKGELELLTHQLQQIEAREKDLYVDTDTRLRAIEEDIQAQEEAAAAAQMATAQESEEDKQLNQANLLLEESAYKMAFEAFDQLIKDNPDYLRIDEAKYGLGKAQYSLKNYKSAIVTQEKLVKTHPDSVKAPDALLVIGNAQIQLGRVTAAKKTFKKVVQKYPDSEAVPTAKKRLKVLSAF